MADFAPIVLRTCMVMYTNPLVNPYESSAVPTKGSYRFDIAK